MAGKQGKLRKRGSFEWKMIKAQGSIIALCQCDMRRAPKKFIEWARFTRGEGMGHDASAADPQEQVGILAWHNVEKMLEQEGNFEFGQCGENICVTSAELDKVKPGDFLWMGSVLMEVTKLGKLCPKPCAFALAHPGPCLLAQAWIFARVLKGGQVSVDDSFLATG